jgi:succinate dehydrogenase/fumarate reductase flavoprotein subunit
MTEPAAREVDVARREVDVIVIGAGAVGENAVDYAHRAGSRPCSSSPR